MLGKVADSGRARRPRPARSKAQMCLWLPPELLSRVRTVARERGISTSELIERLISTSLEAGAARQLEATALPALADTVRMVLDEHSRRTEDRLAKLLTRNIIASDTTRRLLFAHMARQWGGAEQIRQ